jgi:transcriptional regulator GlxA family with amidase domain
MVHFDLLMLDGALPGAVWSAVDVLRGLNALERVRSPKSAAAPTSWRVIDARERTHPLHAATCNDPSERRKGLRSGASQHVLLVPPIEMRSVPQLHRLVKANVDAVRLVRRRVDDGAIVGACGSGIWLLAQAGCLTAAPVPWLYQSGFARFYPSIRIESRQHLLATERVICAAAPSLTHALVLHMAQYAGLADLAQAGAQALLFDAERQLLSAEMDVAQVGGLSRDVPLYRAQSWFQRHAGRPLYLREAAAAAAVSERTLSRLFRQHLDCTPQQYLQDLRVARARMWLEGTWRSVDEIAHDSGYRDTSAFCRMFARATGTSPQRYRERLTLRGPRARWKLGEVEPQAERSEAMSITKR